MIKQLFTALGAMLVAASVALGAEQPWPGSTGTLTGNGGGQGAPVTVGSGCTLTLTSPAGGTLTCAGTGITSYPGAGIVQSTGSGWGTSITPGSGVATALAANVGVAGAFVVNGGVLGTPSSGVGTNLTSLHGHQVSLSRLCTSTTGSASSTAYACSTSPTFTPVTGDVIQWDPGANDLGNTGLAPTLAVNGAAAATIKKNAAQQPLNPLDVGLVKATSQYELVFDGTYWTLLSQMANDISTYSNAPNNSLTQFYAAINNSDSQIVRILDNADSEHTCWLSSTCAYGPASENNLFGPALIYLLQRRGYPLYSTGLIGPISVASTSSLFSNGILPGITCTGSVTQVSPSGVGPQQTGALTGGGTLQMAASAVCTVAVSTFVATAGGTAGAFNRFRVYCMINSTTGNMTITISGQGASTACTGTNGSPLAQAFTVTNTAGTTALTVAITCTTGTCNLGGYEEIYTTANNGIACDCFEAAGGATSYWLGGAAGNTAYLKLTSGYYGLIVHAIGINDAVNAYAGSTVTANMATVNAQFPGASVLVWSSFPYTGTGSTNYPAIQAAEQAWALTNFYDFLNTADNASSNTSINYWTGIENSDTTHPSNMGAAANFAQFWIHVFGSEAQSALTFGANLTAGQNGYISFLNSLDTSSNAESLICYVTSMTWCGARRIIAASGATFQSMWSDGVIGTSQTAGNGKVLNAGAYVLGYSITAGTQVPAIAQTSFAADPVTGLVYLPFNTVSLTASYSNATVTPSNITGWTWPILNGQTMIIDCDGMYQAAATGGLRFEVTGPTMTGFQLVLTMGLNSTAASMASPPALTTIGSLTTAVAVTTATTNYAFHLHVYAQASAGGTLQLQGASAAAVNMTIGIGSTCTVKRDRRRIPGYVRRRSRRRRLRDCNRRAA